MWPHWVKPEEFMQVLGMWRNEISYYQWKEYIHFRILNLKLKENYMAKLLIGFDGENCWKKGINGSSGSIYANKNFFYHDLFFLSIELATHSNTTSLCGRLIIYDIPCEGFFNFFYYIHTKKIYNYSHTCVVCVATASAAIVHVYTLAMLLCARKKIWQAVDKLNNRCTKERLNRAEHKHNKK